MRKTTFALGLGLALSLGAADLAAQASPTRPDSARAGAKAGARGDRAERARGERGARAEAFRGARGHGVLLRGITLTDAQKAQLKTLHEQRRTAMRADSASRRQAMETLRAARQRGDTAAVRQFRERQQAQMTQAREREIAAVRAVLTAEQRTQFDRNVAELKERAANRPAGGREGRGARGPRGARGARQGA